MKKTLSIFTRPVPMWLFALWIAGGMSVAALAAVPLYTGSLTVPAAGAITANQLSASSLVATTAGKVLTSTTSGLSPTFTGLTLTGGLSGTTGSFNGSVNSTGGYLLDSFNTATVAPATASNAGMAWNYENGAGELDLFSNFNQGSTVALVSFYSYVSGVWTKAATIRRDGLGTFTGLTAGTGTVQGSSDGSHTSYYGPAYTTAGAAVASTYHSVIIPTITTSASQNTGCPSHGTFTTSYCGSVTLSGASTFASMGSSSGVFGNTMPSFVCGGVPWQYYGTAHLFLGYNASQGLVAIDDSQANVIFFINSAAQAQTGPIVCEGT